MEKVKKLATMKSSSRLRPVVRSYISMVEFERHIKAIHVAGLYLLVCKHGAILSGFVLQVCIMLSVHLQIMKLCSYLKP